MQVPPEAMQRSFYHAAPGRQASHAPGALLISMSEARPSEKPLYRSSGGTKATLFATHWCESPLFSEGRGAIKTP